MQSLKNLLMKKVQCNQILFCFPVDNERFFLLLTPLLVIYSPDLSKFQKAEKRCFEI